MSETKLLSDSRTCLYASDLLRVGEKVAESACGWVWSAGAIFDQQNYYHGVQVAHDGFKASVSIKKTNILTIIRKRCRQFTELTKKYKWRLMSCFSPQSLVSWDPIVHASFRHPSMSFITLWNVQVDKELAGICV